MTALHLPLLHALKRLEVKLESLEEKIDDLYANVEQMREDWLVEYEVEDSEMEQTDTEESWSESEEGSVRSAQSAP